LPRGKVLEKGKVGITTWIKDEGKSFFYKGLGPERGMGGGL